jgi:hypothetical protein
LNLLYVNYESTTALKGTLIDRYGATEKPEDT